MFKWVCSGTWCVFGLDNAMDVAVRLLRIFGSPYVRVKPFIPRVDEVEELYGYACKNRMGFYFLYTLERLGVLPEVLRGEYERGKLRYRRILEVMVEVSECLNSEGIEHAVYKSLRPYPSTTVDIDVIIFDDYERAYVTLRRKGYRLWGFGPETITLMDPSRSVGVDLYREVAVSRIIYLDKWKLRKYRRDVKVSSGKVVSLTPEADIVAVVAHLTIKEQIFTLADYYTILYHLKNSEMNILCKLAGELCVEGSLHFVLLLMSVLHQRVYGKPLIASKVRGALYDEVRGVLEGRLEFPVKLGLKTMTRIMVGKLLMDGRTRSSMVSQILYLMRRSYLRFFISQLIDHMVRETY